jgi:hypothetical protein
LAPPPPPPPRPRRHSHQRRRRPVQPWRPRAPAGSGELVQRGNRARSGVGARRKWEWRQRKREKAWAGRVGLCLPVRSGELVLGAHVQPVRRRRRRHVLHEPNAADPVTTGAALSGRPQPQVPRCLVGQSLRCRSLVGPSQVSESWLRCGNCADGPQNRFCRQWRIACG